MGAQNYKLLTFNGNTVDGSGNIKANFKDENGPVGDPGQVDIIEAVVPGRGSAYVRGQLQPVTWLIQVQLTAKDETDVQAAHKVFDELNGPVWLRAQDGQGSPVTWRIKVRQSGVMQRVPKARGLYTVAIRVSDPFWEEDTESSHQDAGVTTSPLAYNLTNNGSRKAYPKATVQPTGNKSRRIDDFGLSLRGFIVNRAPFAKKTAYLFDQSGVQARLATDSLATGAAVKNTTGATTITADIAAGASVINLTSVASWNIAGGMGFITDTRGAGSHDQFYYTGVSGLQLTGVVWLAAAANGGSSNPGAALQTGGGIAHTVAQVSSICPSGVMLSGDDVRVFLDDVEVDRWLVSWNSAASDIVIADADLPPARTLTLAAAMDSSSATMASLSFNEDVSWLKSDGFLVIGDEVIHYSGKGGDGHSVTGIVRPQWGTSLASHAANASVWANPRYYVIGCGWAKAGAPPAPTTRRPCFQLPGSSNQTLKYGDGSDDSSSIFFDRNSPDRPMQFVPGFDNDGNDVAPIMRLAGYQALIRFEDDVPGDGSTPYNYLELFVPEGIKSGDVNAIKHDWGPAAELMNLELFTRDIGGVLKLQDELQQSAAATARALPAALSSVAYGVKLKGRYNVITGQKTPTTNYGTITNSSTVIPSSGHRATQFKLDAESEVSDILAMMALDAAGTQWVTCDIYKDNNGVPDTTDAGLMEQIDEVQLTSTTPRIIRFTQTPRKTILPAGTYWVVIGRSAPYNVNVRWYTDDSAFRAPRRLRGASYAAAWDSTLNTHYMLVTTPYTNEGVATVQSDQPVLSAAAGARSATFVTFDKAVYTLNASTALYGHRTGSFSAGLYHCAMVIENTTTGDKMTVNKWMLATATLVIDAALKTVVYTEAGVEYPVVKCVTFNNLSEWLALISGVNAMSITETDLGALAGAYTLTIAHRGRKR